MEGLIDADCVRYLDGWERGKVLPDQGWDFGEVDGVGVEDLIIGV